MIVLANHHGNPYVGVYCCVSGKYAIVPPDTEPSFRRTLVDALKVEVTETTVAGATIVGSLAQMNSRGVVLSNFASREEIDSLPPELEVALMEERYNAAGNNLLVNDRAAVVHPEVSSESIDILSDVLGVEVVRATIAGISTVGSVALINSKGILCHPRVSDEEMTLLKELFSLPVTATTLNYGIPWIGACAAINDKGAVIGDKTTPIELGKLEDGLGYI